MGYPNIVFTKADVAVCSNFCLMRCLPSQGHLSVMCLWLILSKSCCVICSKIGGTYIFTVSHAPPQHRAESCNLKSALPCLWNQSWEYITKNVSINSPVSTLHGFNRQAFSGKMREDFRHSHAECTYRTCGWRCISPPSSKSKTKITILN